jgi:hypothetical protein
MSQNTSTGAAPTPLPSGSVGINIVFLKIKSFLAFMTLHFLVIGFFEPKEICMRST